MDLVSLLFTTLEPYSALHTVDDINPAFPMIRNIP